MSRPVRVHRIWPDPAPLDDAALYAAYAPDRASGGSGLRINFVTSLDGAVEVDGYSAGLSDEADRHVYHVLRAQCDALLVGAGTLRHERYDGLRIGGAGLAWRRQQRLPDNPTLVVVSSSLRLDPAQLAFADAPVRPVVLTHSGAPSRRRAAIDAVADIVECDNPPVDADPDLMADPKPALNPTPIAERGATSEVKTTADPHPMAAPTRAHPPVGSPAVGTEPGRSSVNLAVGLAELRRRGLRWILCEGGPVLFGALLGADLVDELCLTIAPLLTGAGADRIVAGPGFSPPRGMRLVHLLAAGDTLLTRYARTSRPQ